MTTEQQPTPPTVVLSTAQLDLFEAWWGQRPVEPRSAEDTLSAWVWMAWQAATLAAAKEHASLCRKERLHWKLQGQKDTRDFELCALRIEQSNARLTGPKRPEQEHANGTE